MKQPNKRISHPTTQRVQDIDSCSANFSCKAPLRLRKLTKNMISFRIGYAC